MTFTKFLDWTAKIILGLLCAAVVGGAIWLWIDAAAWWVLLVGAGSGVIYWAIYRVLS